MTDLNHWLVSCPKVALNYPGAEHSFVSGVAAERPIKVKYHYTEQKNLGEDCPIKESFQKSENDGYKILLAEVCFTNLCQGPPDHAHGGSIAAVLDELMGGVGWLNSIPVVARNINVDFLVPIRMGQTQFGFGQIVEKNGKKLMTHAALLDEGGAPLAQSKGVFIELGETLIKNLA